MSEKEHSCKTKDIKRKVLSAVCAITSYGRRHVKPAGWLACQPVRLRVFVARRKTTRCNCCISKPNLPVLETLPRSNDTSPTYFHLATVSNPQIISSPPPPSSVPCPSNNCQTRPRFQSRTSISFSALPSHCTPATTACHNMYCYWAACGRLLHSDQSQT